MTKIYAPNKRYTGIVAGVSFINGVAETDNEYLIGWFKEKGYTVEEKEDKDDFIEDIEEAYGLAIREDLNKKTVKELIEKAKTEGIEGYSDMKKEGLVEVLAGE